MIAAPSSGSGKTLITCGLLNLLKEEKRDVTSFKCGPDYIDPMFHRKVLGIYGGNLDTYFCPREKVRDILFGCGHEIAVIEGVMGIYDGIGGLSIEGSCYDIARATDTPIVLVVDGRGAGRSLFSVIKGILSDDREHLIKGLILNRVSENFYRRLKALLEKELKEEGYDVRLLGAISTLKNLSIDSRHLGLLRPDEVEGLREKIHELSEALSRHLDIEALLGIMEEANDAVPDKTHIEESESQAKDRTPDKGSQLNRTVNLAVAMDDAFCFYYKENLELFEKLGVSIKFFSPLKDRKLPENNQGIYIGGGYPELHLKELSDNITMKNSIKAAIDSGLPSIAECGGFMYLHELIFDEEGRSFEMVGAVTGSCRKMDHLVRFGYVELFSDVSEGAPDSSFSGALSGIRGHEFHYYDSTDNGACMLVKKGGDEKTWRAMHVDGKRVFGFPHLYLESKPFFAEKFVEAMRNVR